MSQVSPARSGPEIQMTGALHFVDLESPMHKGKFQDHGTSGSEDEDFKGFGHIQTWQPY